MEEAKGEIEETKQFMPEAPSPTGRSFFNEQRTRRNSSFLGKRTRRVGRWTETEHERFLDALRQYGKDWHMIARQVGTRHVTNIRAHA